MPFLALGSLFLWLYTATALTEDVYISEVGADILGARGVYQPLSDYMELDLKRANGANVRLKLRENKKIDVNAPVYHTVLENGQLQTKVKDSRRIEGVKFYYDKEARAALKVTCEIDPDTQQCKNHVEGSLNIEGDNYDITPLPDDTVVVRSFGGKAVRHALEKATIPAYLNPDTTIHSTDESSKPGSVNSDVKRLLLELLQGERVKRAIEKKKYAIEIIGVADPTFWTYMEERVLPRDGLSKRDTMELEIRQRFALIVHGVSMLLEDIDDPEYSIYATISGFYMMDTIGASSPMAAFISNTPGEGYLSVTVDRSGYMFAVRDELTTKGIPHDDHYMVFTWVDLNNGAIGIAGFSSCCYENRISVNEYNPSFFGITGVAAHELGHNIGANHDHQVGCPDYYIMYSGPTYLFREEEEYNKKAHPWTYSPCSVKSIGEFLKKWGGKCLLDEVDIYNKSEWTSFISKLPGEVYNADQQCKLEHGDSSYMCRREIPPTDPEFCVQMSCLNKKNECKLFTPTEGTECGFPSSNKYCQRGKCVQKSDTSGAVPLIKTGDAENCFKTYSEGYIGTKNVTKSGAVCQSWSSQEPHRHKLGIPENFLDASVPEASNYCRDPDGSGRPWCFLGVKWDFCEIPMCSADKKKECETKIQEYQFTLTTTKSGYTCQRWDSQSPNTHSYKDASKFPDATLSDAANFCRNPDGSSRAWCYTTSVEKRWEYCGEKKFACTSDTCYSKSITYTGKESLSKSGRCQSWSKDDPHNNSFDDTPEKFPDKSVADAGNSCRDPSDSGQPWCYLGRTWEECNIQKCT